MEAAGLSTGVVSLAFDVFDNTIRIFKFLSALVDMPKECEKYRLQLIIEYNRVLAWGKAAGLVDVPEGSTLAFALGTNATELISIVARIQWLLAEFRDINGRYENELNPNKGASEKPTNATDIDVARQISSLAVSYEARAKERRHRRGTNHILGLFDKAAQNAKEIVTHPARVRWIMVDQEAFEALLKDLHVLTERLHELMRDYREKRIDDITAKTYREMILTRNGVKDLRDMLDAVTGLVAVSSTTRRDKSAHGNDTGLQDLIRLKQISRTSETILSRLTAGDTAHFDLQQTLSDLGITVQRYTHTMWDDKFWLNEEDDQQPLRRPRGILTNPEGVDIPVWIEWKAIGNFPAGSLKDKESALRTVALAEMLHMQKPASLHVPECIGYFDDREITGVERYGWIFKMAEGSNNKTQVRSLYEILGDQNLKPTLSQRLSLAYKLCSTVLNLHAANWLHKGIFSDNIIFHFNIDKGHENYDPTRPCLSGFEFSRPEGSETTSREIDLTWDIYRWPGIQRQAPTERNSRKTYDLYSLGLVLLEIAHWEPLWKILGLTPGPSRPTNDGMFSRVGTMQIRNKKAAIDDDDEDTKSDKGDTPPTRKPAIIPSIPLSDTKQVRDWLLGTIHRQDDTTPPSGPAPFKKSGKPNPVKELRNITGDRYCEAVTRCLWAHGKDGFGVDENYDHADDGAGSDGGMIERSIKLQEAFTHYVVEELEGVVV